MTAAVVETKMCMKCGQTKLVQEFHVSKHNPDGRYPHCKACRQHAMKLHRRRAVKLGNGHEPYDFAAIIEAFNHTCYLQGLRCVGDPLTEDHVIPVSRGGPDMAWNIMPACGPCNYSKGDRLLSELPYEPAIPPDDLRLWLAPGERWD